MTELKNDFEEEWNKYISDIPKEAIPTMMAFKKIFFRFYANGQIKALNDVNKRMNEMEQQHYRDINEKKRY